MRKILPFIFIAIVLVSCEKKEETRLEASNPEAFAFNVDNGWEINASVRVKGFQLHSSDNSYTSELSYKVDLITPQQDTIKNIADDKIEENSSEEIMDLPVETQIVLDSAFTAGKYKIVFNITDELSGQKITTEEEIELSE